MKLLFATMLFSLAGLAQASERLDHFKGEQPKSMIEAYSILQTYNEKLEAIIAQETLSASDLNDIHQITYSLENALQYIDANLRSTAEQLEVVHKLSETGQAVKTLEEAKKYLKK